MSSSTSRLERILGHGHGVFTLHRNGDNGGPRKAIDWHSDAADHGTSGGLHVALLGPSLTWSVGRKGAGEAFETAQISWRYPLPENRTDELDHLRVGDRVYTLIRSDTARWLLDDPAGSFGLEGWRVVGYVTDQQIEYVTTLDELGAPVRVPVFTARATGPLGRAGQIVVGSVPWSSSSVFGRLGDISDAARAAMSSHPDPNSQNDFIVAAVPVSGGGDAAELVARDVDRQTAADLWRSVAEDAGGYLFEDAQDGQLTYESIEGRRNRLPIVELGAEQIEGGVTWARDLGGLVNRLTLTYGPEDARAEVTVEDPVSIALFGDYSSGRDTQLALEADAERIAYLTVARNSRPRWTISELRVNLVDKGLTRAQAAALAIANIGDLVAVTGLPATAPPTRYLFVEGVEHTVTAHDWWLTLYLSHAGRTGAPIRWQDVRPALTWAEALVDDEGEPLTWLAAAAWFDPPGPDATGWRWVDVPTDQKWWHLAAGETRDPDQSAAVPTWSSYPDNP